MYLDGEEAIMDHEKIAKIFGSTFEKLGFGEPPMAAYLRTKQEQPKKKKKAKQKPKRKQTTAKKRPTK